MATVINENTEIIIQGITGRESQGSVMLMKGYGTKLVAGVTPGKGGQMVQGIPVYNSVQEAKEYYPDIEVSCILVPATQAKLAVFEAMDAGVKIISLIPERVPQHDMLEIIAYSKLKKSLVIGPNSVGIVSPGKSLIGMIGGTVEYARKIFSEGPCGVISRSGTGSQTVPFYLTIEGIGQSTVIGSGGDAFVGATWCDILPLFEEDKQTEVVVAFGEIGTAIEENAAQFIKEGGFTKPLVVYIAGRHAVPGFRFGHAGAIITRGKGSVASKIESFRDAGAYIVDNLADIGKVVKEAIAERGGR
jgi:succinyl-CoA synthetase alpha subunit